MNLYTQPDLLRVVVEERQEQLRRDADVARLRRQARTGAAPPTPRRPRWLRRPERRPALVAPPLGRALTD